MQYDRRSIHFVGIVAISLTLANFGTLMCTDARIVVPKLVGQKVRKPRRSLCENGIRFSMSLTAVTKRR